MIHCLIDNQNVEFTDEEAEIFNERIEQIKKVDILKND